MVKLLRALYKNERIALNMILISVIFEMGYNFLYKYLHVLRLRAKDILCVCFLIIYIGYKYIYLYVYFLIFKQTICHLFIITYFAILHGSCILKVLFSYLSR